METALKLNTTVLPGHRIEVIAPELLEGAQVELIVTELAEIRVEIEAPIISAKSVAAIAFLERKLKEDVTDDPEEIRKSEEEFEELQHNLNANRDATGERRVFA